MSESGEYLRIAMEEAERTGELSEMKERWKVTIAQVRAASLRWMKQQYEEMGKAIEQLESYIETEA